MNTINNTAPPDNTTTIYIVIGFFVFFLLSMVALCVYIMTTSQNKKSASASVEVQSNMLIERSIEMNSFKLYNNQNGNVEITNGNKLVWSSKTPGGDAVAWMVDTDGLFTVYHKTNNEWKSVKSAVVVDKKLLVGPYSFVFDYTGVLNVFNIMKKDVWNTKTGQLQDDTSKTYSARKTTVSSHVSVTNENISDVSIVYN